MQKITIKKNNKITNQATFKTLEELNAWLSIENALNSFGYPERELLDYPLGNVSDELKAKAISTKEVAVDDRVYISYKIPAEFEVEIEDITAQYEKEQRIKEKIALGEMTDNACVSVFKLIQGYNVDRKLTKEQKDQMIVLFAPALQAISVRRPLELKKYIQSITPDGILVTDEIKEDILDILGGL